MRMGTPMCLFRVQLAQLSATKREFIMNPREKEARTIKFFTQKREEVKQESEVFYTTAFVSFFIIVGAMIIL